MSPTDEALLQIYQATKGDRNRMEALFNDFEANQEYLDMLDKVRDAMSEGAPEMYEAKDIGDLATGAWDNTVDLSNIWAMHPERRREYSMKQIQIMLDTLGLLRDLIDEITKQESEAA